MDTFLYTQKIITENFLFFRFLHYFCIHMKYRILLFLFLTSCCCYGSNRIWSPRIKTLTSIVNGDWLNRPVMELGSVDKLIIGFDELSHNYHRMTYHIEHCEADWTLSEDLFESDWLAGFNDNQIEDYQNSINTTVQYTHYQLQIPNDRCSLKMSGNYRVKVFDEDNDNELLLEVEFYVVEPLMDVSLAVTTNTDIDHNDSHQQLTMAVNYNGLRVVNREEELYTVVMQNWREDIARYNPPANLIRPNGLEWEHNKRLIFDAGNEFHKFEILDISHPTMGIDRIEWDGQNYQVYPFPSTIRRNYLTDVDADGAFLIRNSERSESDYTCDYVYVNYLLTAPYIGELYLSGLWTDNSDRDIYKMLYSQEQQSYYITLFQKQGYYSYQYLKADNTTPSTEGSFYQTQNRYQALVYYRNSGSRTWRLVGYRALDFR